MSEHHAPRRDPALRFTPPRRRRLRWLVIALGLAASGLLAAVQGQPVTEPGGEPAAAAVDEPDVGGSPERGTGDGATADDATGGDAAGGDATGDDSRGDGATADGGTGDGGTGDDGDGDAAALTSSGGTPEAPEPGAEDAADGERDAADGSRGDGTGRAPHSADAAAETLPPLLGSVDPLELRLPAHDPVVVGFHEASSASHPIAPIGQLLSNENTTRFEPDADRADGGGYHVLSSRGRIHPPTSAVDIVLRDGVEVLAPVTGLVADVREYHLYGQDLDHRIEIHPDAAPELRVVLVHVDDVRVEPGDRVSGGTSVIAGTANRFPFSSQIDRETEPDRWPHVHLEVQPIDAPRPGDDLEE